ncbi:MAG: transketolase C-terminal domain-containing protein [Candidatus Odinarchaeota archaeon]
MSDIRILTGNYAVAEAVKQSNVDVIAAYPITPQTQIVEALAAMVETGMLKSRFIRVEGERSAMAVCIGAASTGCRVYTATSSQGLVLMHELLYWAAASRLPIVMTNVNRTLAPPWNIWVEHTDSMLERDSGWIQIYASTNQELYDLVFQCFKLAESSQVQLPVMLCMDGFLLSHTATPVRLIDQNLVDEFLPEYNPSSFNQILLDVNKPFTYGNVVSPATHGHLYYKHRYLAHKAMITAGSIFKKIQLEFEKLVGRVYGGLTYEYNCSDADLILISIGTLFNQTISAVDRLRKEGYKIGALKVRSLRPFPHQELKKICKSKKAVFIIDRDLSPGIGGILSWEVRSSLLELKDNIKIISAVAGLGGMDVTTRDIMEFVKDSYKHLTDKIRERDIYWIGLKGEFIG